MKKALFIIAILSGCATADRAGTMMLDSVNKANDASERSKKNEITIDLVMKKLNGVGKQLMLLSSDNQKNSEGLRIAANNLFELSTQVTGLYRRKDRRITRLEQDQAEMKVKLAKLEGNK